MSRDSFWRCREIGTCHAVSTVEALLVEIPQVSYQAASLCELTVAEYATELPPDAAFEPDVTNEVALGHVGPVASRTLPLAAGIPDLTANRSTVTIQGKDMGVTFAAVRTHIGLVCLRYPRRGATPTTGSDITKTTVA